MRTAWRGGEAGARGVPGKDLDCTEALAARRVILHVPPSPGFVVNPEDFSASLVMSDGSPSGAVLRLRSMFEVFAAQIAWRMTASRLWRGPHEGEAAAGLLEKDHGSDRFIARDVSAGAVD